MTTNFPELADLKLAVALPSYNGTRHNGPSLFHLHADVPNAELIPTQTSLLAMCFNVTLATAMMLRDQKGYTHFLMLHDDIVPTHKNWFEQLWSAYCLPEGNNKTGMLCAVSPIKDHRGLTSIAVEVETGEKEKGKVDDLALLHDYANETNYQRFKTLEAELLARLSGAPPKRFFTKPRRLTMTEIMSYPETFSHPGLLLNTGCLLFDLREPWVDQATHEGRGRIYFTVQDHIEWIGGKAHPSSASEDWNFTRMARAAGCSNIYATRAMPLEHVGQSRYPNNKAWGLGKDDGT